MKVIVDDKIPFIKGVLEPYAEVEYLPGKQTTAEVVRDADALITRTRTICNEDLLKGSRVRVIATATIGYDHIDTDYCESHDIVWRNAPGCNSWSVKQYISSVLVTLSHKHHFSLEGRTLGVVGVGNVGSKVADAARLLGMRVLLCDPPRARREGQEGFVTLDTIISESDIITVHVPLNRGGQDNTLHLFDSERISQLRHDQILINSSRGPVVDNECLKRALLEGRLLGAVLDVWEGEPNLDPELVNALDISTPHIAGYSADGKANGTTAAIRVVAEQLGIDALKDWSVQQMPLPRQSLRFGIDCTGKTLEQVLSEAILYTYRVQDDSDALRCSLSDFERLRGDYPVRREPTAFTVELSGSTDQMRERLSKFGFNIINK